MMRTELNALRQAFSDCIMQMVVMLTEVWGEASARITVNDFESLLQDETHDGWLMEETVAVIMRTDVALTGILMIDLNVWTAYVNGGQQKGDLLILSVFLSMFVVILYYFDNHWAVTIIEVV